MIRARVERTDEDLLGLADEMLEDLKPRMERAMDEAVEVILEAARRNLRRRRGTARTVAPAGEPPEYDSGALHDSLRVRRARTLTRTVHREYGSDHKAAGLHEFGGTVRQNGRTRIYPARPYMRPAEEEVRAEVERILEDL